jgi:hypothetical protein
MRIDRLDTIGRRGRGLDARMLPARNRRDYDDIPAGARKKLEFVWLERVDDAIAAALEVGVTPLAPRADVATQTVQSAVAARYARCPNPRVVIGPSRNPALRSRLGAFC